MKKIQELFEMSREVSRKYPDAKNFAVLCTEDFIGQLHDEDNEAVGCEAIWSGFSDGSRISNAEIRVLNGIKLVLIPVNTKYIGQELLITILP